MAGISDDQFRKILDNNIVANHWLISMVAPEMVERGEGSIIIVSSIGGLKASEVIGAYNVSKAADFQLARNLAAEFGRHQVRVNCIAPGLVRTIRQGALGEPRDAEGRDCPHAAQAHRRAARDRRRGRLPGVPRFHLRHRPGDHRRRRLDDGSGPVRLACSSLSLEGEGL
jgi:NAD(P)-dependent dehydrogenase (short-subunit alcohol dehydrogenase family)